MVASGLSFFTGAAGLSPYAAAISLRAPLLNLVALESDLTTISQTPGLEDAIVLYLSALQQGRARQARRVARNLLAPAVARLPRAIWLERLNEARGKGVSNTPGSPPVDINETLKKGERHYSDVHECLLVHDTDKVLRQMIPYLIAGVFRDTIGEETYYHNDGADPLQYGDESLGEYSPDAIGALQRLRQSVRWGYSSDYRKHLDDFVKAQYESLVLSRKRRNVPYVTGEGYHLSHRLFDLAILARMAEAGFDRAKLEELISSPLVRASLHLLETKPIRFRDIREGTKLYFGRINSDLAGFAECPDRFNRTAASIIGGAFFLFSAVVYPLVFPIVHTSNVFIQHSNQQKARERRQEAVDILHDIYEQSVELSPGGRDLLYVFEKGPVSPTVIGTIVKFGFPFPEYADTQDVMDPNKPTVLIAGTTEDSLALAREADRHGGANIVIVEEYKTGRRGVTASKGLVYREGRLYRAIFQTPILADYLFPGFLGDESRLKHVRIPMAGTLEFTNHTENKEAADAFIRRRGIRMPPSLFWQSRSAPFLRRMEKNGLLAYQRSRRDKDIISDLANFCLEHDCDRIVVKPADGQGGDGVKFFSRSELRQATAAIKNLLGARRNVIVEKFIVSAPLVIDGKAKDWNVRVFVSRDSNNAPVVSDMEVRVDDPGKPVNISISAGVVTFEKLALLLALPPDKKAELWSKLVSISIATFGAVEEGVMADGGTRQGQQQDFMGIDVIVPCENETLTPVVLEVNDHHAGGMWDLDDASPQTLGGSSSDLAQTMIRRAQSHFLSRRG